MPRVNTLFCAQFGQSGHESGSGSVFSVGLGGGGGSAMSEWVQRFEIKSTEAAWNGPSRPANGAGGTWWGWQKIGPQMVESQTWLRMQLSVGA